MTKPNLSEIFPKKVYQTKFGLPGGNCFNACLATIFGLSLDDVPDFMKDSLWYERFTDWSVKKLGLQPIDIQINGCPIPRGYHIINGESKNGDYWHSVVGKDGEIFHDPHPDGALKNQKTYTLFMKAIRIGEVEVKEGK